MFYKQYTKALLHSQLKKKECCELSRNKFGLTSRDSRSYFNFPTKRKNCAVIFLFTTRKTRYLTLLLSIEDLILRKKNNNINFVLCDPGH